MNTPYIQYIYPFIEAAQSVMRQFGIKNELGKVSLKASPQIANPLAVIVGITGDAKGQAIFGMDKPTALQIVSGMSGFLHSEFDEIVKSGIQEFGNIISGNTMTLFAQNGISLDITPPILIVGNGIEIETFKNERILCIPFNIDEDYSIEIHVVIKAKSKIRGMTE